MDKPTHIMDPRGDVLITLTNPTARWERIGAAPSPSEEDATFLCSRKLLIQASPVFRSSLDGSWKIAERNPGQPIKLDANAFDEEALWKVLRAVHLEGKLPNNLAPHRRPNLRTGDPLRPIDIPLLAEVARVVDYYGCIDVMASISRVWIDDLELEHYPSRGQPHPIERYYPGLVPSHMEMLIFSAWALRDPLLFKFVTIQAVVYLKAPLAAEDYHIPALLIDAINTRRCEVIASELGIMATIKRRIIERDEYACNDECRTGLLARLDSWMSETGLDFEMQDAFWGFNFYGIVNQIRAIETGEYADENGENGDSDKAGENTDEAGSGGDEAAQCPFQRPERHIEELYNKELLYLGPRLTGLDLKQFVRMNREGTWDDGYSQWKDRVQRHGS